MGCESETHLGVEDIVDPKELDLITIFSSDHPLEQLDKVASDISKLRFSKSNQAALLDNVLRPTERKSALLQLTWYCLPGINKALQRHKGLMPDNSLITEAMLVTQETLLNIADNSKVEGLRQTVSRKINKSMNKYERRVSGIDDIQVPQLTTKVLGPEQAYEKSELSSILTSAKDTLSPEERYVIQQRYPEGLTYRKIGISLGLSGERIRQMLAVASRKLRGTDRATGSNLEITHFES